MAQHHALGQPSRAGRVDDVCQVDFGIEGGADEELGVRGVVPVGEEGGPVRGCGGGGGDRGAEEEDAGFGEGEGFECGEGGGVEGGGAEEEFCF